MKRSIISNDQYNYANTGFILLSIINNKIGIVSDLYESIFKHIKYVQIMKKTISSSENDHNFDDIQKIIDSYAAYIDNTKHKLFGNKDIFDDLVVKHKCKIAEIQQNTLLNPDELIIYIPDLFPIKKSSLSGKNKDIFYDPNDTQDEVMLMSEIFSTDPCNGFVIKNPILVELRKCIMKKITWQIYKCNHPILNLLLSNEYVQCGVMEHEDYYFTGFLRCYACHDETIKKYRTHQRKTKITLITPKKRGNTNSKPPELHKIVKEFIVIMQNIKDNFGIITDVPCYEILCNNDVDEFIENYNKYYWGCQSTVIHGFETAMKNNKNNCYAEYKKAYNEYIIARQTTKNINSDDEFDTANDQICRYIHSKCNLKLQRERYHLNFRTIEFII